jgi:hypothetical protein
MVVKCGVSVEGMQRVWWAPLNQTSGLQGHPGGGWGDLAGDDLGTGSGWKQSRQNQTPLCSDEIRSPSTTANLSTALATPLHLNLLFSCAPPCRALGLGAGRLAVPAEGIGFRSGDLRLAIVLY